VYRKQVRRRRAVLALLVISSFALLTATYGQESGGLQKGVSAVLSPLQEGADRALKPARDLINWFDETFEARGENDRLGAELQEAREKAIAGETAIAENEQLRKILGLRRSGLIPSGYEPVTARVIAKSPTVWYSTVTIDKGSSSGVTVDDPVMNGDGLVGRVSWVTRGSAGVTLITDPESAVSAKVVSVEGPGGAQGVVEAEVGDPEELVLDFIDSATRIRRGDDVVTAGWRSEELASLFPPNLPIGRVTDAPITVQEAAQQVHLRPFADMRSLDFVDVLTGGSRG
jgi:rod shape-determining protein MreC